MEELRNYYYDEQILQLLKYSPFKYMVYEQVKLCCKRDFEYFYWETGTKLSSLEILKIGHERIYKVNIISDLTVSNESGVVERILLKDFTIEFFIAIQKDEKLFNEPLIMNLNELIFHLNLADNIRVKEINGISELCSCKDDTRFNFLNTGCDMKSRYFPKYSGPALDSYFQDELTELYAVASNSLAFLFRYQSRVFEELTVIKNLRYNGRLNIFPRFNNAIAETAGTIYNFIERIAFFLNEFYPINATRTNTPSFGSYMRHIEKQVKLDPSLSNKHYEWFLERLNGPHKALSELRHPTVHYNKKATVSGMRSAAMIQQHLNGLNPKELKDIWSEEIQILTIELKELDKYLEEAVYMIEKWGSEGLLTSN